MPTPIFICGAECNLAAVGTVGVATEHWSSVAGSPSVVTSGPATMRSTRCFRFNTAGAPSSFQHTFATAVASPATLVARFYVYFASLPSANTRLFQDFNGIVDVWFVSADSTLRAGNSSNPAGSGVAITTGQWYRVDVTGVRNTTTTCDIQVNGVAAAQFSVAGAAGTFGGCDVGVLNSVTADVYIDDLIVSGTAADYPIGAGTVAGLYPNGDGAHNYNSSVDFGKGGTALTALNANAALETTSWQSLQNPLTLTVDNTKFISDQAGANTEYLEWTFDDLPAAVVSVNGLMVVTCNHSATATASNIFCRLNDNGNSSGTVYPASDFSELTIVTAVKTFPTAPSTAASWTKTRVDALKLQWGLSTDVNPDPILDGAMLEVDYVPSSTLTATIGQVTETDVAQPVRLAGFHVSAVSTYTGSGVTAVVPIPPGNGIGDTLVAYVGSAANHSNDPWSAPGWTILQADASIIPPGGSEAAQNLSYHTVDGSEGWVEGSTVTFTNATGADDITITIVRTVGNLPLIDTSAKGTTTGAPSHVTGSFTPTRARCMVLGFISIDQAGTAQSWTPAGTAGDGNAQLELADIFEPTNQMTQTAIMERQPGAAAATSIAATYTGNGTTTRAGEYAIVSVYESGVTGLSATIGQVLESDSPQAFTKRHARLTGQVQETDAPQVFTPVKRRAVGQLLEVDVAQPLAHSKLRLLGQLTEVDLAQPFTKRHARAVAQVLEVDTPQALAARHARAVTQVLETDVAQTVKANPLRRLLNTVQEADLAQAFVRRKTKLTGQVTEVDVAQLFTHRKNRLLGQVTEADLAQQLTHVHTRLTGQVLETDLAQALTHLKRKAVLQVLESDLAQAVSRLTTTPTIQQAQETDSANPFTRRKVKSILQAVEADTAQAFTGRHVRLLTQVIESDAAQPVVRRKTRTILQTVEVDVPQPLARRKLRTIQPALEVDQALALVHAKVRAVGLVQEVSAALAMRRIHARAVSLVQEVDLARPVTRLANTVGLVVELDQATSFTFSGGVVQVFHAGVLIAQWRTPGIAASRRAQSVRTQRAATGVRSRPPSTGVRTTWRAKEL